MRNNNKNQEDITSDLNLNPNDDNINGNLAPDIVNSDEKNDVALADINKGLDHGDQMEANEEKELQAELIEINNSVFRNSSIFIRNDFESIDDLDKKKIRFGLVSKRTFDSVLDFNPVFRKGAIGLSFFSLFDRILFNALANNATRIGAVLSNKIFIRKVMYDIINEVTIDSAKQNRGFIKKSFQISRKEISDKIVNLLSINLESTREPQRTEFIEGLAGVIEIGLVAQLVNYNLYDIDDLNEKILSTIDDKMIANVDYMTLQNNVIVHSSLQAMIRIFGSATKLSDVSVDDNKYKSVDHAVIIDNFLEEMDQIASVLLMENIKKTDIDEIFIIARLYRDKDIFLKHQSLQTIVTEVCNYVETNIEGFKIILSNYDMNLMLDHISKRSLLNFNQNFSGKLHINTGRYNRALAQLKASLYDDKSQLKIYSRDEFVNFFSLTNHINKDGYVYHLFLRRNLASGGERVLLDTLVQKFKPSRDLVRTVKNSESYIMLANEIRNNAGDFTNTLNNINRIMTEAEELSFLQLVSECMPNMVNGTLYQISMVKQSDVIKLAALNSDHVYVPLDSYCVSVLNDVIEEFPVPIDLNLVTQNANKMIPNMIFVKQTIRQAQHMDWFPSDFSIASITTREPRRIIECLDSYNGNSGITICSSMLKAGKYIIDKGYMNDYFDKEILIWPKNKSIDLNVELDDEYSDIQNFVINIDFDKMVNPSNFFSLLLTTKDIYIEFIEEYLRSISIFKTQIIAAICSYDTDINQLRFNVHAPDLSAVVDRITDNENYRINKRNVGHICYGFFDTGNLFNQLMVELCSIENGAIISRHIPSVNRIWYLTNYYKDKIADGPELIEQFKKNVLIRRNLHYRYSFQYSHMQLIIQLYNNDKFFKNIVDACLQHNSSLSENNDILYAYKLIEMYSKQISTESLLTLQYVAAVYVSIVIRMMMSKSGDLNSLFTVGNKEEIELFLNEADKLDMLIYSRTKLILSRKGLNIFNSVPNGKMQSMSIMTFKSMFEVNHEDGEGKYANKILSSVDAGNRNIIDDIKLKE